MPTLLAPNPVRTFPAGRSRRSHSRATSALEQVAAFLTGGATNPLTIPWHLLSREQAALIRAWAITCFDDTFANATLAALRSVLRRAGHEGQVAAEDLPDVIRALARTRRRGPSPRPLAALTIRALIQACEVDCGPAGRRDAALIGLMAGAGLGCTEASALDWRDYDRERGLLLIRSNGGPGRALMIGGTSCEELLLRTWDLEASREGAVFRATESHRLTSRPLSPGAVSATIRRRARTVTTGLLHAKDLTDAYTYELGRRRRAGSRAFAAIELDDGSVWLGFAALDLQLD